MTYASRDPDKADYKYIGQLVWEGLNTIGRTIPQIQDDENKKSITGSEDQIKFREDQIWHSKSEIDRFVLRRLGQDPNKYGGYRGDTPFYNRVAKEIAALREKGILTDFQYSVKSNRYSGIWRLDKRKLEEHALEQAHSDMDNGDYRSEGTLQEIYARKKQSVFKEKLQDEYCKCALCGFKLLEYTIGAHIVPYHIMRKEDPENAMNPVNGLLLCRFCDVAFERGTIKVHEDRRIEITPVLQEHNEDIIRRWLEPIPSQLVIKKDAKYPPAPEYLKWKMDLVKESTR